MRMGYKQLGAVLGAVALLGAAGAGPVQAQEDGFGPDRDGFIQYSPIFWSLDARGGVALPVGDFGDVTDPGPTIGAGFAYFLNPNFALRLDGNVDFYSGRDEGATGTGPDVTRFSYFGGFEAHLTDPAASGAQFAFDLGAGGVTFNSDQFVVETTEGTVSDAFQDTYFALKGGARVGVNLSEVVALFLSGQAHVWFGSEEDSESLAAFYTDAQPFGTGIALPIQGGLRINIP